jgi:hypothetical protein
MLLNDNRHSLLLGIGQLPAESSKGGLGIRGELFFIEPNTLDLDAVLVPAEDPGRQNPAPAGSNVAGKTAPGLPRLARRAFD